VYTTGIAKNAAPSEKLKSLYNAYKLRMNARPVEENIKPKIRAPQPPTKSKISVYTDESSDVISNPLPEKGNTWDDFGTLEESRKENSRMVQMMAGSKLRQSHVNPSKTDEFAVYDDAV